MLIMPREAHENMVLQTDPNTGSMSNVVVSTSLMGIRHTIEQDSAMCLSHSSKHRGHLQQRISILNAVHILEISWLATTLQVHLKIEIEDIIMIELVVKYFGHIILYSRLGKVNHQLVALVRTWRRDHSPTLMSIWKVRVILWMWRRRESLVVVVGICLPSEWLINCRSHGRRVWRGQPFMSHLIKAKFDLASPPRWNFRIPYI